MVERLEKKLLAVFVVVGCIVAIAGVLVWQTKREKTLTETKTEIEGAASSAIEVKVSSETVTSVPSKKYSAKD